MRGRHIRILSDRQTAVAYVREMGGTHSLEANNIAREIWEWAYERRMWLSVAHIPGKNNTVADLHSREFDYELEWMLHKSIFRKLVTHFPDLENASDLFASRLNAQLDRYVMET